MLANLLGCQGSHNIKTLSAFRIENPSPPVTRDGKMMVWENIPGNDWRTADAIMTFHSGHMDNLPLSLASDLSKVEWNFVERAASALAQLGRMSDILPGLVELVRRPVKITEFLQHPYNKRACYEDDPEIVRVSSKARYALAWWIAMAGYVFHIRTKYATHYPVARAVCAVLFSKPYRADWADCELAEMEEHAEYIHALFEKYENDFVSHVWHDEINRACPARLNFYNPVYYLASNFRMITQLMGASQNMAVPESRNRIGWEWVPDSIDIYDACQNLGALPNRAGAIPINPASRSYAPMYAAYDDCDMPIVLIPENPKIWDAMLGLYGLPKRDPLYPESARIMDQLSPRNAHFTVEMSEAHGMVYMGIKSLGEFMQDLPDADNPDYQFHAFAADLSKWNTR